MRKIEELMYKEENAWIMIQEWALEAKNKVKTLPNQGVDGENTLFKLQITNKSTMGAIALECGGILIDNGWLKILGSGHDSISGNILSWNNLNGTKLEFPLEKAMIIAYDIIGGFYAINTGEFGSSMNTIFYFAPDTLEWENLEMSYTDFLYWAMNGDLDLYYKQFRWLGWEKDIESLDGNQGVAIYPYLWSSVSHDIEKCSRKPVSMLELWGSQNEFANQINEHNDPHR